MPFTISVSHLISPSRLVCRANDEWGWQGARSSSGASLYRSLWDQNVRQRNEYGYGVIDTRKKHSRGWKGIFVDGMGTRIVSNCECRHYEEVSSVLVSSGTTSYMMGIVNSFRAWPYHMDSIGSFISWYLVWNGCSWWRADTNCSL